MSGRPTGALTFLFTDVEGSTKMWEAYPTDMEVALALHDDLLNAAIERAGGYVFTRAGDSFAAAFAHAADALRVATEVQHRLAEIDWPGAIELRVRVGLHTGTAHEREGDYFGPDVNRTARIMSVGHGGQILLSSATAELVGDAELVFLGEHRLKDLSAPERIFQVANPDVQFAPLRTLDASPGNLPVMNTSFVGRDEELQVLTNLIRHQRVVTLTGVGGVGKTRLALQVAAEVSHEFADGAWLVELAPIGDPGAVADKVAAAVGVMSQPGASALDSILQAISRRNMLIVLDNCEHLVDSVADLVDTITARSAGVTILATSREAMRTRDEQVWPVAPLDVAPNVGAPALQLFADRAHAVSPSFRLDDEIDSVREICARLDGIALAIELAAARMASMTASEVRDRLDDRFRLLAGSRRGIERHQTLHHAVGWSYDLLDDAERALLALCSVFADGFDVAAAAHVGGLDTLDALDVLDSLVRKSLVTVESDRGRSRYGLLETIREFAEDRLADAGGIEVARRDHARHYADEAERHWLLWNGPGYGDAVRWLEAEFSNLRAAFRWALDESDFVTATRLASHAAMLGLSMQLFEPVGWAEEVIAAGPGDEIAQLPRLFTAASLCLFNGRADQALEFVHRAGELAEQDRFDPFPDGLHRFREANVHHFCGRLDIALEIFSELAARDDPGRVSGACARASVLIGLGRLDEARAAAESALALASELGNPFWVATALQFSGRAYETLDPDRAMEYIARGRTVARDERVPFASANLALVGARITDRRGDALGALDLYSEAVELMHRSGELANVANVALAFASLAHTFERLDRPTAAATMLGVVRDLSSTALEVRPDLVERLRTMLDEDYERWLAVGAAMELADAVRFVRSELETVRAGSEVVV